MAGRAFGVLSKCQFANEVLPQTPVAVYAVLHRDCIEPGGPMSVDSQQHRQHHRDVALDDLLRRSGEGDAAAFAQVYAETASRAFGLALRVIRNEHLAEEVTQEAFLTIWRTAARFDPRRGTSNGWILMIVHRAAVDCVRSVGARAARDDRHQREETALWGVDDCTSDEALVSIQAQRVRHAMAELSTQQRQALGLAYLGGYTYPQVAELLGIPSGTAKTRIRAALIRLRETMADDPEWATYGRHGFGL